ncbi:MAG: site-specific DNA-methyltransferase, partial [Deltaproteobacteria bacterium]|nr:site-specific DNA-methyltransferase [Deltaproteobacteria bacterium]
AKENINFSYLFKTAIDFKVGDARNLDSINDNSIDLICAHPPYSNIVNYTHNNDNDLSNYDVNDFLDEIERVAKESYRVLKDNKYCSILIGDMRKNKNVIPLGFWTIEKYLKAGFKLKELIIKRQHNCKTTGFWYTNSIKFNFLLLAHEYLAVFEKSKKGEIDNEKSGTANILYDEYQKINFVQKDDIQQESTTVWIFEKEDWIANTLNNLIKRYSKGNYGVYNNNKKISDLLIYFYDNHFIGSSDDFDTYLENEGILAIICEDDRLNNHLINSSPVYVEKFFNKNKKLKIKEIVVVQIKDLNNRNNINEDLNINHKYIVIYKKV